jgi:hypothetical protein
MTEESNVRCDACGCAFAPKAKTEEHEGIERTFFSCPYCGNRYLVAVTDEALRQSIRQYTQLARMNKVKRLPERTQKRLQKMKEKNVQRGRALRGQYPLEEEAHDGM